MFFVSNEEVRRFCPLVMGVDVDRSTAPQFLEYFSNLYEPLAQFSLGQREQAERQWCDLTDHGNGIYLLLAEVDGYSLWSLCDSIDQSMDWWVDPDKIQQSESVEPLVRWLLQTLWIVIEDLAGADRARAFGRDVLASSCLGVGQEQELRSYLAQAAQPVTTALWQQGEAVVTEFCTLAARFVGRDCAEQVCATLSASTTAIPIIEPIL